MIKKNKKILYVFAMAQIVSISLNARWFWYQPVPVVVYQEPPIISTAVGLVGLGLGISSIIENRKKKNNFKNYTQTFMDMGYSKEQSKIYAQMAIDNPEGLQAVVRSIDQKQQAVSKITVEKELLEKAHQQKVEDMKVAHDLRLQEISHEQQLKTLTYLVILLSVIMVIGVGLLLFRRQ